MLRSGFLPRVLGWLLLLDGVAVLVWFLQVLVAPAHPAISYPASAIGLIAELGLGLWLLVRGVALDRGRGANVCPFLGVGARVGERQYTVGW